MKKLAQNKIPITQGPIPSPQSDLAAKECEKHTNKHRNLKKLSKTLSAPVPLERLSSSEYRKEFCKCSNPHAEGARGQGELETVV